MVPTQKRQPDRRSDHPAPRFGGRGSARRWPWHAAWIGAVLLGLGLVASAELLAVRDQEPSAGDMDRPLPHPGDREAGAVAYASCAVCHGVDGAGRADGTFPRIAGQHASVVVKQISDIRSGRRGNPIMASHVDELTDPEEIADIAVHIEHLSPSSGNGRGDGEDIERGGALYQRDCTRCHGAQGEGRAETFVPVVAGQHYAYLLRQLRAIAGSRRRNAHPEMVEAVFDYPDGDLRAVAGYLSQLPWPPPTAER